MDALELALRCSSLLLRSPRNSQTSDDAQPSAADISRNGSMTPSLDNPDHDDLNESDREDHFKGRILLQFSNTVQLFSLYLFPISFISLSPSSLSSSLELSLSLNIPLRIHVPVCTTHSNLVALFILPYKYSSYHSVPHPIYHHPIIALPVSPPCIHVFFSHLSSSC